MAERRMISKVVFSSDDFIELPPKARLLYTYMILYSDDHGFTNAVKRLIWESGASQSDLKTLIDKGYIIHFESGAYLVAHWPLMNKVQPSRATETAFAKDLEKVILNDDKVYILCQQDDDEQPTEEQIQAMRKQIADDLNSVSQQSDDKD